MSLHGLRQERTQTRRPISPSSLTSTFLCALRSCPRDSRRSLQSLRSVTFRSSAVSWRLLSLQRMFPRVPQSPSTRHGSCLLWFGPSALPCSMMDLQTTSLSSQSGSSKSSKTSSSQWGAQSLMCLWILPTTSSHLGRRRSQSLSWTQRCH